MERVGLGMRRYTYDELNRLVSVSYEGGQTIVYTYDAESNLTAAVLQPGEPEPQVSRSSDSQTLPGTPQEKRCRACGHLLSKDARFCPNCGTPAE